uniref:N-methyl-D-aspartate receptor glutamate-binding subunit n=1 Tax=Glossina morsitans morsitans TaxID=37546 RepID=D3TQR8_GLOMM
MFQQDNSTKPQIVPPSNYEEVYNHKLDNSGYVPSIVPTSPTVPVIDPEDLEPKNFSFNDQSVRRAFIRKVYLILMGQLCFTFGMVAFVLFHEPTLEFIHRNSFLVTIAMVTLLVMVLAMACCDTARRTYPTNFICLSIFTFAESFVVAAIAGHFNSQTVLMAVGITAFLCLVLTIFAMQSKYDFTACGGILLTALVCVVIFGFITIFWNHQILRTMYACLGAFVACILFIYDTQLMMGGDHKYSISPEEYIFAALNLYMDVGRIFLFVLTLIGGKK